MATPNIFKLGFWFSVGAPRKLTGWLDHAIKFFSFVVAVYVVVAATYLFIDPWVLTAYLKLKYWEAKGLDTTAYAKDFVNVWEARIGKSKGAPVLTLAPRARSMLIGINNIPDGSWNVGNGISP